MINVWSSKSMCTYWMVLMCHLLFVLYLIELLGSEGCRGIFVSECFLNVNILLYADDLVLCWDMAGGL